MACNSKSIAKIFFLVHFVFPVRSALSLEDHSRGIGGLLSFINQRLSLWLGDRARTARGLRARRVLPGCNIPYPNPTRVAPAKLIRMLTCLWDRQWTVLSHPAQCESDVRLSILGCSIHVRWWWWDEDDRELLTRTPFDIRSGRSKIKLAKTG